MNVTALLLVASVVLPLLLALGLASRSGRGVALALAPWAALPAFAAGILRAGRLGDFADMAVPRQPARPRRDRSRVPAFQCALVAAVRLVRARLFGR